MIKLTRSSVNSLIEKFGLKDFEALNDLCCELNGNNIEILQDEQIQLKREALANHLGISTNDVRLPSIDDHDDEFEVSFGYIDSTFPVEVVTKEVALANEGGCTDFDPNEHITETGIGCYTKILLTDFYFRWL